ncbi:MAG: phosphoglycerate mutase family protein [Bacteroidetes bacterium]|nr:phosphoglycerate mutase family protein [Bacteroidota bacterium]
MEKVKTKKPLQNIDVNEINTLNVYSDKKREHAEFHNCHTEESVKDDIAFLKLVYKDKISLSEDDVTIDLINNLKVLSKDIYFFLKTLESDLTPQNYIKSKYEFIRHRIPNGDPNMFYLAWNGLIKNDSFRRLLLQTFSLNKFNDMLCPQNIPVVGSHMTRYRTKLVLANDMATNEDGSKRTTGRLLDDGSGLNMKEGIVWLPNEKAIPLFPQGYVPLNQTQVILIRHGKSTHESGGENPEFVGSGYWDIWDKNRRISGAQSNFLKEEGVTTARELGKDFKIAVDILDKSGFPLWSWSKDTPVPVYGSESENTEQTARYFLQEAGYTNLSFNALFGLNSQKYGALTFMHKNEIMDAALKIYSHGEEPSPEVKAKVSKMFKNRFYHYPEGETLIEADWRIAFSFVDLLNKNLGKRLMLVDHSGAIRVFEAIIRTLDFAEYSTIKEAQDSIIALCYQPGRNLRYDYLQKKEFLLRKREKK